MTDALPAAALVLIPQVGGLVYILGSLRPLKQTLLGDWQFLLLPQPPQVFTLSLTGSGTLGCMVCPEAGIACSPVVPVFIHT